MRQVSFTLLITSHYNSNPAQYESNCKFGPVVLRLGRMACGANLPSVGIRLKASKSESLLVTCSDTMHASCTWGSNARWHVCSVRRVGQWRNLPYSPFLRESLAVCYAPSQGETFLPVHRIYHRPSSMMNMLCKVEVPNRL